MRPLVIEVITKSWEINLDLEALIQKLAKSAGIQDSFREHGDGDGHGHGIDGAGAGAGNLPEFETRFEGLGLGLANGEHERLARLFKSHCSAPYFFSAPLCSAP